MHQNDNLLEVLRVLYKWRKHIISATILSALVSIVICLMLPNYYKAVTLFYAASPDLAKPQSLIETSNAIRYYGSDGDRDRLLSFGNSTEIKEYLIQKYKLYDHYDIDKNSTKSHEKIRVKLEKLYNLQKNKFDAIELSVEDVDRELAAEMSNDARERIDALAQDLIKSSQKKQITNLENSIKSKSAELAKTSTALSTARNKYKIFHLNSQGETYAELITKTRSQVSQETAKLDAMKSIGLPQDSILMHKAKLDGTSKSLTSLEQQSKLYNEGYNAVYQLELSQKEFIKGVNLDKERLKQLSVAYESPFSALHLVETAEVPVLKSRPKRSIIVIGIVILTFILMTIFVLVYEQSKNLNWSRIKDAS